MVDAVNYGFNVVRMLGFSVQVGSKQQLTAGTTTTPPTYDGRMLEAFDKVIAEADRHDIKLIIALADNWDYTGDMSDCN